MKIFYFGPYKESGHCLFTSGGRKASKEEEKSLPWSPYDIDGILQPNCTFKFMRFSERGVQNEGEAILHYRDGWTALCFWDRSVDKRGACNSNFIMEGTSDFEQALELSKKYFADRFAVMKFEVVQAKDPNNSLICSDRLLTYGTHKPGIVHRTGGVSADILNTCSYCGHAIGYWHKQWVKLDSWSERAIRDGKRFEE